MQLFYFQKSSPAPESVDLDEYQRMTLKWVLLCESVGFVLWQMVAGHQLILLAAVTLHILALWLSFKRPGLAGAAWLAAFAVVVGASALEYKQPELLLLFALAPAMGVLIYGLLPGLLTEAAILVLVPGISALASDAPGLADWVAPSILGGLVGLIMAGIFRYWFVKTVQFYYEFYQRAAQDLESARLERLERRQVEDDLLHANRELARLSRQLKFTSQAAEEARRAKQDFVAMVSHELRTPLNMIIGFSEVIAQSPRMYGVKLPATLKADIGSIQRNSQHLLELVNDVLDLSQVDMGNLAIVREWVSAQQLAREACEVIQPLFQSKKLYLKFELLKEDLLIYCDRTRIREVMINLLSNAGRFTEQGGVYLRMSAADGMVTVAVQDTGPGISPENQKKLFEPFQQLDSSIHRKYGGSGLGLAISKRFIEMHNGSMWLESGMDVGSTFFFRLPIGPVEADLPGGAARWISPFSFHEARTRTFKAPSTAPAPHIVILEEGYTLRRMLERYAGDVEITATTDMEEALRLVNQTPCQMLLLNHLHGQELLKSICSQNRLPFGLPVLALWLPGNQDTAEIMGVQRYLIKPISSQTLLGALAELGSGIKTVLLMDDNPEVLQLFGRILSSPEGKYKLLRASDGQHGLDMMRLRHPDAVILDLVMPEKNGFQVLEEKAADPAIRDIPVIVITAQDPAGLPRVSEAVMIAQEGGYSPRDLLDLIGAVNQSAPRVAD